MNEATLRNIKLVVSFARSNADPLPILLYLAKWKFRLVYRGRSVIESGKRESFLGDVR
jgi:hypothetical protein